MISFFFLSKYFLSDFQHLSTFANHYSMYCIPDQIFILNKILILTLLFDHKYNVNYLIAMTFDNHY